MATIHKKIWLGFYDDLASGRKKYDLRLNDFAVAAGDTIILEEWDQNKKEYTGRTLEKKISYAHIFNINDLYWPKEELVEKGIVVMSLE
ncbi:MAG: DUF3850 domain-containing protein [Patescibacteria group bacterium]